jgi:glycosyltransferase involved in cell wall biosynthesis
MRTLSLFWWETLQIQKSLRVLRPDLVHAWGTERGAALVASRLSYPSLVTMQGLLEWCQEKVDVDFYGRLEARLERVSLRRASRVTAESRFAVSWLQQRYPALQVKQIEHAPNRLFHNLERRPVLEPVQFLYVGTACRLKGTDLLVLALDRLKERFDFQLTIVSGEAADFVAQLKNMTSAALWQRIRVLTNLSQDEVGQLVSQATIMLFPTRVDNSPNSVKEAVVAGLPVVASAIGGITDYVVDGKNGITFTAGDIDAFTKSIHSAVEHPLFGRGCVDTTALSEMRKYLSAGAMASRFLEAYRSLRAQEAPG